jgi:hypothetical protein
MWGLITRYYRVNLAQLELRLGTQALTFDG